jgi:hypothetical protein
MPTIFDFKNKTGFIHIPKTSGTTYCRKYLIKDMNYVHMPASVTETINMDLTTIVRNPYSRFISAFLMMINYNIISYEKTIEGLHKAIDDNFIEKINNDYLCFFKPMVFFTHTTDLKQNLVKNIIKFEDIIKTDDYLAINFVKNVHFELSNKAIAFVNNLYKDDFREFNYEMKSI